MSTLALPGDVLVVRSSALSSGMIRFGAALLGKPNLDNHVAVVHHKDANGTLWCLEGRPGGVGWRQASDYMSGPMASWTLSNSAQPRTDAQRAAIAAAVLGMLGAKYDWDAIVADGVADLHLGEVWMPQDGTVHGETVCSALAAYAYDKAGVSRPAGRERTVQPADWTSWVIQRGWEARS